MRRGLTRADWEWHIANGKQHALIITGMRYHWVPGDAAEALCGLSVALTREDFPRPYTGTPTCDGCYRAALS